MIGSNISTWRKNTKNVYGDKVNNLRYGQETLTWFDNMIVLFEIVMEIIFWTWKNQKESDNKSLHENRTS